MSSLAQDELGHATRLLRAPRGADARRPRPDRLRPTRRGVPPFAARRPRPWRLGPDDDQALALRHGQCRSPRSARRFQLAPAGRARRQGSPRGDVPPAPRRGLARTAGAGRGRAPRGGFSKRSSSWGRTHRASSPRCRRRRACSTPGSSRCRAPSSPNAGRHGSRLSSEGSAWPCRSPLPPRSIPPGRAPGTVPSSRPCGPTSNWSGDSTARRPGDRARHRPGDFSRPRRGRGSCHPRRDRRSRDPRDLDRRPRNRPRRDDRRSAARGRAPAHVHRLPGARPDPGHRLRARSSPCVATRRRGSIRSGSRSASPSHGPRPGSASAAARP